MAFGIVECRAMESLSGDGFVGLVIVSHSAAIASGLAELVAQVAGRVVGRDARHRRRCRGGERFRGGGVDERIVLGRSGRRIGNRNADAYLGAAAEEGDAGTAAGGTRRAPRRC